MNNTATNNIAQKIDDYCQKRLKEHFQDNSGFLKDFSLMFYFYASKFSQIVTDADRNEFEEYLYQAAVSQFYNGYYMARELLEHKDSVFPDEWFMQKNGILKERIPFMMFDAAGSDFDNMIRTNVSNKLVSWSITKFEDIRGILQEVFVEITLLGSVQAFIDEREARGIKVIDIEEGTKKGIIAAYNDLLFIDPQKYLVATYKTCDSETWDINLWSAIRGIPKIGEITVQRMRPVDIDVMKKSFPLYQNRVNNEAKNELYYVFILLHDTLREGEIAPLVDTLIQKIINNNGITKNEIILSVPFVNDYLRLEQ